MAASSRQSGFTLVEITVVLVMIGLVIAAAIKGYQLYRNTQLQAVYSKLKEYEAAAVQFKTAYRFWPGDFRYATTNLVGCTAGSMNLSTLSTMDDDCADGDADSQVGSGNFVGFYTQTFLKENFTFFRHMALAGLLDSSLFQNGTTSIPTTPIGGIIFGRSLTAGGFSQQGLHLIFAANATDDGFRPILPPREASYLDGKFDDGKPGFGRLKFRGSNGVGNDNANDNCTAMNQIYKTTVAKSCVMGMYIEQ